MTFIVQTQINVILNDRQSEFDGLKPLAIGLTLRVDLNLGNQMFHCRTRPDRSFRLRQLLQILQQLHLVQAHPLQRCFWYGERSWIYRVGTNIARKLYHAARAVSTASCWFSLLVEDTALSISKTDAYFSITSARKAANALHSSSVGAEYFEEVGLFSVRWKLFNRQLHFLVAELWQFSGFFRNVFLIYPIKFFKRFSFFCAFSFRKLTPMQETGTHISNRRS